MLNQRPTKDPIRWIKGHHLFFGFCQGLILAIFHTRGHLHDKNYAAAAHCLERAITLLAGVTAAFRYTGDLASDVYGQVVEPTMKEREGFSGLWSSDHAEFLRQHRELLKGLDEFPAMYAGVATRYRHAASAAYMAHSLVCRHAAGIRTSLNAQSSAKAEEHLPGHAELKYYYRPKALYGHKLAEQSKNDAHHGVAHFPLGHNDS